MTTRSTARNITGYLSGLVLPFGDGVDHRLGVLTNVELSWTHEVADVLDDEQVEFGERQPAEAGSHHHSVEVTFTSESSAGVDERDDRAEAVKLVGVEARGDVAFEDTDAERGHRVSPGCVVATSSCPLRGRTSG